MVRPVVVVAALLVVSAVPVPAAAPLPSEAADGFCTSVDGCTTDSGLLPFLDEDDDDEEEEEEEEGGGDSAPLDSAGNETPVPIPTATPIPPPGTTPTATPTPTPTASPTGTASPTATRSPAPTDSPTPTASPMASPVQRDRSDSAAPATATPSPTPTPTPTPTGTPSYTLPTRTPSLPPWVFENATGTPSATRTAAAATRGTGALVVRNLTVEPATVRAELTLAEPVTGRWVRVAATVANTGGETRATRVALRRNGETVGRQSVRVPAGATREVEWIRPVGESAAYDAGALSVVVSPGETATPTPRASTATPVPGFTALAALAAVAALAWLARRR